MRKGKKIPYIIILSHLFCIKLWVFEVGCLPVCNVHRIFLIGCHPSPFQSNKKGLFQKSKILYLRCPGSCMTNCSPKRMFLFFQLLNMVFGHDHDCEHDRDHDIDQIENSKFCCQGGFSLLQCFYLQLFFNCKGRSKEMPPSDVILLLFRHRQTYLPQEEVL